MNKSLQTNYPNICQLFHQQMARAPEQIALIAGDNQLTYQQVGQLANVLAHVLLQRGCKPGDIVALRMPRSPQLFVAMLAILACGAAYLPLDEQEPDSRQQFKLASAGVNLLLCEQPPDFFPAASCVVMSELPHGAIFPPPAVAVTAEQPAYVMFTSGSTGMPKGVVVPHRAVVRLVHNSNYLTITANDRILQLAPTTFDASTLEIWGAWLNGATLVLYSGNKLVPNLLKSDLSRHEVTILWLTAALFHLVASSFIQVLAPLRVLLAGGDVLNPQYVAKVLQHYPRLVLINGYGPTENTTFTCCHRMTATNIPAQQVPIGLPISGTIVFVLDEQRRPVPVGESGELYVGGAGVALGYLIGDSPEFFHDERIGTGLIYRTGDLVRQDADGVLHFIGRRDNQVKVRGYRISLDEVKACVLELTGVRDVVVSTEQFEEGVEQLLVVNVLMDSAQVRPVRLLQQELASTLPAYMIPDKWVINTSLPINNNGKIDRSKVITPSPLKEKL